MSVCWFVDRNYNTFWPDEALTNPQGKCVQANNDFNDALLHTSY